MEEPLLNHHFLGVEAVAAPFFIKRILCQLCSVQYEASGMEAVSDRCQHTFCVGCLCRKLAESLDRNQDLFCPVDYCPEVFNEGSQLYNRLSKNLQLKYLLWKKSASYHVRNRSFHESMNRSFHNEVQFRNADNAMALPLVGANPRAEPSFVPANMSLDQQNYPEPILPEGPVRYRQEVLPFPADGEADLAQIQYTCGHMVIKCLLVAFGMLFLMAALPIIFTITMGIYALMVLSVAGLLLFLGFGIYCTVIALSNDGQESERGRYFSYVGICGLSWLISIGLVKFFYQALQAINYVIIMNMWMWWIKQLLRIWAYPYPAPKVRLGPTRIRGKQY